MTPQMPSQERVVRDFANIGTSPRGMMTAHVGDWIIFEPVHVGEARRTAVIVELRHPDGTPPYLVRWDDSGHEAVLAPGANAHLRHQPQCGTG